MQSRNDMLKISVLRRAIVVHRLISSSVTPGVPRRRRSPTVSAVRHAFFIYVGTVSAVILDHDGAVAADHRAMRT